MRQFLFALVVLVVYVISVWQYLHPEKARKYVWIRADQKNTEAAEIRRSVILRGLIFTVIWMGFIFWL